MSVLSSAMRRQLESAVLAGRRAAEGAARAAVEGLGVFSDRRPEHLDADRAALRNGLRAKWRQLGSDQELLVAECAYEQWHRLLFARFLAENGLLLHPRYKTSVSLTDCEELAAELGEPDGWWVAARFASEILPGIFRLDDPCVRLRLAPEGRHALEQILTDLPSEVFCADDALGWVYQFWQKDKKDEVNASDRKIGGADLGPVTQLFTENYMVRFLLENSLGAWWTVRHPNSPLVKTFTYLRLGDDGAPAAGSFHGWPGRVAEVTVMDPCCGSGHFLVEAFAMLWRMRAEEEGLTAVEAQDAVLRDNLFGLELDPRCVQIAMFAVALQAWKAGGGWRQLPVPNIACSGIPVKAPVADWTKLAGGDQRLENALVRLYILFRDADTLGSLIDPRRATELADPLRHQHSFDDVEWDDIAPLLEKAAGSETPDPATAVLGADAAGVARAADYLSARYTLVATNVPFLGVGKMDCLLENWCLQNSPQYSRNLGTTIFDSFGLRRATTVAMVMPADFLSLPWYEDMRREIIGRKTISCLVRLGPRAFSTPMYDFLTCLMISHNADPPLDSRFIEVDLDDCQWPEIAKEMLTRGFALSLQRSHKDNPKLRIEKAGSGKVDSRIRDYADVYAGAKPGQTVRVTRKFWEFPCPSSGWQLMSSSPSGKAAYDGKTEVIMTPEAMKTAGLSGYDTVGGAARGRRGVLISKMGQLNSCLYDGSWSDDNTYTLIPKVDEDLAALFAFVRSEEFFKSVRDVSAKTAVPVSAISAARVDFDKWRKSGSEKFPDGLPEPWSDDPTQWLFEGRPEVSTEPLQSAVARLVGFRWPRQADSDDLDRFSDSDGIVCLPSVAGEAPAAYRLQELLAAAFEDRWSPSMITQLLERADRKKGNIADWLRDDFFTQHCALFGNRPFVWHIWDGRRDGFSALVNYHKLDRKTLEKLAYTYLGTDWVERQKAEVRDAVAGAEARLAAAMDLQRRLELILEGEAPYDIYVRWKGLHEQAIGWAPDLNDGIRLNIRPFVEAGVLRSKVNIHWRKDRGSNPDGSERRNDIHLTLADKHNARRSKGCL